jgi:hypothetical protein
MIGEDVLKTVREDCGRYFKAGVLGCDGLGVAI